MLNTLKEKIFNRKKYSTAQQIHEKYKAFTMVPEQVYVRNLAIAERISGLDGCIVECGVWRGGMIAGLADMLGSERSYYLLDSFQGLPKAQEIDGESAREWQENVNSPNFYDNCCAPEEYARKAMSISKARNYSLYPGWFEDTLPNFKPDKEIALLRLDADWYESTTLCLNYLFNLVAKGGLIILDDYYDWDGCSKAVHDFLSVNSRNEKIDSFNGICFLVKK